MANYTPPEEGYKQKSSIARINVRLEREKMHLFNAEENSMEGRDGKKNETKNVKKKIK